MPVQFSEPEIETALQAHCEASPIRTNKLAMTVAILRRAVRMTPEQLQAWLSKTIQPATKGPLNGKEGGRRKAEK